MASWIRSAYLSPAWRNSTVGTLTNRMPPLAWLYRVGFSHVSYECRLIFFSNASRMRAHGFGETVVLVADIYEIFSPRGAPGGWYERLLILPFMRSWNR